jgi:hypothetical protein
MAIACRGAAVLACALFSSACSETPIVRNGPPQQRVISRAYGVSVADARKKVLDAFATQRASLPPPFHQFIAVELTPPNYPPDWIAGFVDPGGFLADYKRLPPAERANDLLLREPTGDVYWLSDYAVAGDEGRPVKFRCDLIVHFIPREPSFTEIQVYELVPDVWVGEHWAFARHGPGFGRYHDIRAVEPSVADRFRALDLLDRVLTRPRP